MAEQLLTARELVAELSDRGLGDWSADAVRQWTRMEPPLPIAKPGKRGQAHRFDADQVQAWLGDRDRQAKAKGWTPPAAADSGNGRASSAAPQQGAEPNQFSDPRNWKAWQDGRLQKLKADEMERRLIPAEELEGALRQVVHEVRSALLALPAKTAAELAACETYDQCRAVLDREIETVLADLADHDLPEVPDDAAA